MPSALGSRRRISVNIAAGGVYACYPHCFNERHLARESRGPSGCAASAAPGRKRLGSLFQLQTISQADVWPLVTGLTLLVCRIRPVRAELVLRFSQQLTPT